MKRKRYSPEEKLQVYKEYQRSQNKSAVARKFGINRSYLIEIIAECDQVLLKHFDQKKPGRKKADQPENMAQALGQIETITSENRKLAKDNEELYIINQFDKLRLSWAERDGFKVTDRHLKKTKNKKRSTR